MQCNPRSRQATRVLTTKSCAFVKSARVPTTGTCALLACAGSRSQNPRGVACAQDLLYRAVALSSMRRILMADPRSDLATRDLICKTRALDTSAPVLTVRICAVLACDGCRLQIPRLVASAQDLHRRAIAFSRMQRICILEPAQCQAQTVLSVRTCALFKCAQE